MYGFPDGWSVREKWEHEKQKRAREKNVLEGAVYEDK